MRVRCAKVPLKASDASAIVDLAEEVDAVVLGADGAMWAARLDTRADELRDAADVLLNAGDHTAALRLVGSLSRYAQASGRVDEVRALAEWVLAHVSHDVEPAVRARAQLTTGELAFRQGDQAAATAATQAALASAESAGDTTTAARAEMNLARIAFRDGDAVRITRHAERMLELAPHDPALKPGAVHMLAWAAYTAGEVGTAIERFQENVELYRVAGNLVGMASELGNLGDLAAEAGDLDGAAGYLLQALDLAQSMNNQYLLPALLASAATLAAARDRYEESIELAAAAERRYALAGLMPDPSDELSEEVRSRARRAVAPERAQELEARGEARSLEGAVDLARAALG